SRDETTALSLVAEIDGVTPDGSLSWRHFCLAEATRVCISAGDLDLARRLRRASGAAITRNEHSRKAADAILAEASGSQAEAAVLYSEAADRWQDFSNVVERAHALLGEGRALCLLGRPEASGPLREARDLFSMLGYTLALGETEALLEQVAAERGR